MLAHKEHRQPPAVSACSQCSGIGELEATDMFCGAGGSSLGLEFVSCPQCGRQLIRVTQAINHWDLAVEAHNANFPNADHDVQSVAQVPASRFRRTEVFWASPECINHTSCKGVRDESPEAQRSRATFTDVVRFTAHHRYDAVIVENVIEARLWCEHPDCACGKEFNDWFSAIEQLGYEGQIIYFNSQFALPTPQSRDRMYVVFWRNGARRPQLRFAPPCWCTSCSAVVAGVQTWKKPSRGSARETYLEWGRYGANYTYNCPNKDCGQVVAPAVIGAKSIIDFSLPIERIGDRDKPLAAATRRRIKDGWEKVARRQATNVAGGKIFERNGQSRVWAVDDLQPVSGDPQGEVDATVMVGRLGGQSPATREMGEPMHTITAHDRQIGLVLTNMANATGSSTEEPTRTITTGTGGSQVLVQPPESGLVEFRGAHGSVRDTSLPAHTVTAQGTHHGLLVYNGNPGHVRELGEPSGVVTGRDKQSLLVPYYSTGVARNVEEPMGAVTTRDREALVVNEADIDDCFFRMLQWPELQRAQMMHVRPDGAPYQLVARQRNKRGQVVGLTNEQRTKMIGNAVSSPVATMLGFAVMEALR